MQDRIEQGAETIRGLRRQLRDLLNEFGGRLAAARRRRPRRRRGGRRSQPATLGRCRRRRIQDTRGSRTATVSAIATGMMTRIVRRAIPHRTAITRPATTRVRHQNAAATRRVRGTARVTSRSSSCPRARTRRTGAGAESWAAFFAGSAALSLPIRSDSFQRGCSGVRRPRALLFVTPTSVTRARSPVSRPSRAWRAQVWALGGAYCQA